MWERAEKMRKALLTVAMMTTLLRHLIASAESVPCPADTPPSLVLARGGGARMAMAHGQRMMSVPFLRGGGLSSLAASHEDEEDDMDREV